MRIGISLGEPAGRDALTVLHDEIQRAADDGFASAWLLNIFGLDALTALAVAGRGTGGIELGTAVVPTYPRHPAALAQQALTVDLALDGRLALGIGLYGQLPSYRAMLDREGAEGPGDVAIAGPEDAVAAQIAALADAGVTDFVAVDYSQGADQPRTRALLKSLTA
jgi:alkanesulfonate monooxygenase SsuD/methylene tetrahydromethanopterin reductase-like flavin-dependent oxidoreductase (luciferase family)